MAASPQPPRQSKSAAPVLSGLAGLLVLAVVHLTYPEREAMVMTAALGLAVCCLTWVASGRAEVTAGGVLSVATGLFGYFPVLYYASSGEFHLGRCQRKVSQPTGSATSDAFSHQRAPTLQTDNTVDDQRAAVPSV